MACWEPAVHRVGTVLTMVLWGLCSCHCVSSSTVLPEGFLGWPWVFELQYSSKARVSWVLAAHIPESTKPTVKFWFHQLTRVTILAKFPFLRAFCSCINGNFQGWLSSCHYHLTAPENDMGDWCISLLYFTLEQLLAVGARQLP